MKLLSYFAVFALVAANEIDDLGNKKNQPIDKGPRECGGSKANDSGNLTFKCRSRAKKNTKHCKATCPKGMKVDVGGQPTTRKIRCSKVRKGLTMAWVSKQNTDADHEINPNLFRFVSK